MDTKSGKQVEDRPGETLVIMLPILAMGALIGIVALLMRTVGKW